MTVSSLIEAHFCAHRSALDASQKLTGDIERVANLCLQTFKDGGTILAAGNGGSASDAMHFCNELVNRYAQYRQPLPAFCLGCDGSLLTAIANDDHADEIFARQISALGKPLDIFFAITTSGQSSNILKGIDAAHRKGLRIILLTGRQGGNAIKQLMPDDVALVVPAQHTSSIQEMHIIIIHCIAAIIEQYYVNLQTKQDSIEASSIES